jgi:hypothetical protein
MVGAQEMVVKGRKTLAEELSKYQTLSMICFSFYFLMLFYS